MSVKRKRLPEETKRIMVEKMLAGKKRKMMCKQLESLGVNTDELDTVDDADIDQGVIATLKPQKSMLLFWNGL